MDRTNTHSFSRAYIVEGGKESEVFNVPEYDPSSCKPVEGFEGEYAVTRDGVVWSLHGERPKRKETFDGDLGPRVALYRHGRRAYQPYVHVLVRRAFEGHAADAELRSYLEEEYGESDEARRFIDETFRAA